MKNMKSLIVLAATMMVSFLVQAEDKCLCGPYRYEHEFVGNSVNHFRLLDGAVNAALVRDTERTADRKYLRTAILMDWPGDKSGYVPAFDQLANDGEKICVKGDVQTATLVNFEGANESLTFFESVENIFPFASQCEGAPIAIHIDAVKKAQLPK
jgi:hypothetical protein